MVEYKIVINDPKTGKSVQREVKDDAARHFLGLKIGDKVKGELLDLTGYEFEITGGSDFAGFPMRRDIPGIGRRKVLEVKGVGVKNVKKALGKDMKYKRTMKGMRQRKSVAGNTIYEKTAQVNMKVLKAGKENIFPAPAPAEGAKAEGEKKPEAPAEKKE